MLIGANNKAINGAKVFVTGSTGMIGTALLKHLVSHGSKIKIRAACNRSKPSLIHTNIDYVSVDLSVKEECQGALTDCDVAVMLAADSYRDKSELRGIAPGIMTSNLTMDCNMIEAAVRSDIKKLIYVSSATVYQNDSKVMKESDIDLNVAPDKTHYNFAWQKRYVEAMCRYWADNSDMAIIVVRPSNIYGPFAAFDPARSNFIPALIRKAVDKVDPFEVYGSGDVERDVLYVDDMVSALLLLLTNKKVNGGLFNVGSGRPVRVDEVVSLVLNCAKHKPKQIKYLSNTLRVASKRSIDINNILKTTGWKPKIGIEEGIRRTMIWWQENKGWWKK